MQKLIAKYGAAAHLALLAVAPLFLFPFSGESEIAVVLLWLSCPALIWLLLEPSLRKGEMLHNARKRVALAICKDPLFWTLAVLLLLTGVRALNGGISLVYDAETAKWNISSAFFPLLPGCVEGRGGLPFAALVAGSVLMQGCRHSLGSSARMAFLLVSSTLAGLAAVIAILAGGCGVAAVRESIACSATASFYVGVTFCLYLLAGTVALLAAFERKWNLTMPFFALSVGGTAAAGFIFSPAVVSLVFAIAEIVLLLYVFAFAAKNLASASEFKLLVVLGLALTMGGLLVMAVEPSAVMDRVASFASLEFLPESFVAVREALSDIAFKSWLSHLWIGTGVGSYPLDFRFHAAPEVWKLVRTGAQAVPNGWWLLLAERGIVGAVVVGIPVAFLGFTYVRRLIAGIGERTYPHPCCLVAPLVLGGLAVSGLYGCALLRADVMVIAVSLLAVSASAFSRRKRKEDG